MVGLVGSLRMGFKWNTLGQTCQLDFVLSTFVRLNHTFRLEILSVHEPRSNNLAVKSHDLWVKNAKRIPVNAKIDCT